MNTAANSAYRECQSNPNPDTCSCVTCSGDRILLNGQCTCPQQEEYFLDDHYQACPVGQDNSCTCKKCPTERGFAYDSNTGSCVCAGNKKIVTVSSNSLTIQNANIASYDVAQDNVYCTNDCPGGTQECNGICKCIHNPDDYSISSDAIISFSSSVSSGLTNQINILSQHIGNCNYVCPSNCGNLVWTTNNERIYLCSKPSDGTCSNNIPVGEQTAVVFNNTCQGTTTSMFFVIQQQL